MSSFGNEALVGHIICKYLFPGYALCIESGQGLTLEDLEQQVEASCKLGESLEAFEQGYAMIRIGAQTPVSQL